MKTFRVVTHAVGELLITLGLVLLLLVAWQLWWTDLASGRQQNRITQNLEQSFDDLTSGQERGIRNVPLGDAFALIRIPRFGRDYVRPVLRGIELDILKDGVGYYPQTAEPGRVGNFAIAGHRVTYGKPFNRIDELRDGDPIVIETRTRWFVYRVTGRTIVTPDRIDVVAPVPQRPGVKPTRRLMTLTACHP
ncbi:MAG: class E sortase, partial [Angustibacter sp.]